MTKTVVSLFGILALVTAAGLPAFGQGPVLVVVDTVEESSFHNQISLIGRTLPRIEAEIVAEVAGRVAKINAGEGTFVKAGQPLVSLASERIRLSLEGQRAKCQQAEAMATLARDQLARARALNDQDLTSPTGLDSAIAWEAIQTASFLQEEAVRKRLELDLESSVIRAPFDGYTGRRLVDVGEWATLGQEVFEMVDLSLITVIVDLPERYFGQLSIGSEAELTTSNSDPAVPQLIGRVAGISPNASPETHTYPVMVEVKNPGGLLGGGMLVETTLSLGDEFSSLAVSKDAIVRHQNATMVYTIEEGKATPIPVTIGSTSGDKLAVASPALRVGMTVVVRGNERIYPGALVTTGDEDESVAPDESTIAGS